MKQKTDKQIVVAVSGGFDPVHEGHIRMFKNAKALGDKLVVILNNDNWLMHKKGYVFMTQEVRKEILESIRYVDEVILTQHAFEPSEANADTSVCGPLAELRPDIFANGGDRKEGNVPEYEVCKALGIQMAFDCGGEKANSSSELVKSAIKKKAQSFFF